jgi:hypothetical protein
MRVWSDAGWMLAEVSFDKASAALQAGRELERSGFPASTPLHRAAFDAAPLAVGRWSGSHALDQLLALMLPYLRQRLALALGEDPKDLGVIRELLHLRARLYVSSSHLDLVASMDDIWMPARIAGLDRDPGWLPRFGRVLVFHFE